MLIVKKIKSKNMDKKYLSSCGTSNIQLVKMYGSETNLTE